MSNFQECNIVFRKGLETLQRVQICHGNLSLESVVLRERPSRGQLLNNNNDLEEAPALVVAVHVDGDVTSLTTSYCCTITQLGSAVRVPLPTHHEDGELGVLRPPVTSPGELSLKVAGRHPQYMAPELWIGQDDTAAAGGYAADLWSAGIMLMAMLLGDDALFAAPIPADPVFRRISQNLIEFVATLQTKRSAAHLSKEAVDLLQRMLRIDLNERLTLADVQQHPWLYSHTGSA